MAFTLVVDTTYTHNPHPKVVMSRKSVYSGKDNVFMGVVDTWNISGVLLSINGALPTQITNLKNAYDSVTKIELKDGTTVRETIDVTGMDAIIKTTTLDFPEGFGPEYITKRAFSITLETTTYIPSGYPIATSTVNNYTISYTTGQNGKIIRVVSGTCTDEVDRDATAEYAAFKTAQGWANAPAGYNRGSDSYTANQENSEVSYSITDTEYFIAFPANITSGSLSVDERLDDSGNTLTTKTGWYEGSGANCIIAIDAIREAGAAAVLLNESISRDDFSSRTNFTLEYLMAASTDEIDRKNTYTISTPYTSIIFKRVLGGGSPVRQATSVGTARATQSGQAVKVGSYPTESASEWPLTIMSQNVTRHPPVKTRSGTGYLYRTSWDYSFESASAFPWPD